MTDRATCIHCARVFLRESRARRTSHRAFSFRLLEMAANQRRKAMPVQGDLFGSRA